MAFKEWFQKLRPVQLYIVLVLTGVFFAFELIISHFTHSLTLLVDSYHMLCNMIALTGCIITIKKLHPKDQEEIGNKEAVETGSERREMSRSARQLESSLKNTFGWARIDILVMLIGCIFLGSLCFSVLVEAVQTLIHIDHHDEMHFPLVVLMVAAAGLLLNGFCYSLIGGYTFHQGSYLHVTENGEVILERAVTVDSLRKGQRRLSSQSRRIVPSAPPSAPRSPPLPPLPSPPQTYSPSQRQGLREMIRDVIGCFYVIACGLVVYFTTGLQFAKYLDPVISIISAVSLLVLSYPYRWHISTASENIFVQPRVGIIKAQQAVVNDGASGFWVPPLTVKESGLILLQTIPDDINIDSLRHQLLQAFPDIVNVHDLHVWQLTADKIISTAHVIFLNPRDYLRINEEMTKFFNEQGITQMTIQAEFVPQSEKERTLEQLQKALSKPCLMQCLTEECRRRHCCVRKEDSEEREELQAIKIETPVGRAEETTPGGSRSGAEHSRAAIPKRN